MKEKIKEILKELYIIDWSLRSKESELIEIIEKMINSRPDTHFSADFEKNLKQKILDEAKLLVKNKKNNFNDIFKIISLLFSWWLIASFIIFALIPNIFTISSNGPQKNIALNNESSGNNNTDEQKEDLKIQENTMTWIEAQKNEALRGNTGNQENKKSEKASISSEKPKTLAFNVIIDKVWDSAFWNLKDLSEAKWIPENSWGWIQSDAPNISRDQSLKMDSDFSESKSMIAPDFMVNYKYIYKWKSLQISEKNMDVFRKTVKPFNSAEVSNFLKSFDFWNVNLWKFQNLSLNNLNMSENRDFWLQITIDTENWIFSASKNYKKWPVNNCLDDACFRANKIKISDIPEDNKLIEVSDNFIKKYEINVTNFWKPIVDNSWRENYNKTQDKDNYYIPETMQVIYPLLINWKNVFEQFWQQKWLTIWVDIKSLNVSDVYWIEKLNLESSSYEIENNFDNILKIAEKWWNNQTYLLENSQNTKEIELNLGEPSLEYVHIYEYKNSISNEYYVPAYIFPVTSKSDSPAYFQNKIIVSGTSWKSVSCQ